VLILILSVIMISIGILISAGIAAFKFIPKDFLEVLGYNLDVNNFMKYGILAFTIAGIMGSLSIVNFNELRIKRIFGVLSVTGCAIGIALTILAIINWNLTNNFYILIFFLALMFMELSLMFLEIYSILEGIRENWRG